MQLVYLEERNADFLNVCERIRKENKHLSVTEIAKLAVYENAESFYIDSMQYLKIIQLMRCSADITNIRCVKKELYNELFRLYWEIKKANPTFSTWKIAKMLNDYPAPRFYMSEITAIKTYYNGLHAVSNRSRILDNFFRIQ